MATLTEAVERYVDRCVWTGDCLVNPNLSDGHYGDIAFGETRTTAHRAVFMAFGGEVASDEVVRHKCDNPPCVNPDHLEPGSPSLNSRDMYERNRRASVSSGARGESNASATLDAELVTYMRQRARAGATLRAIAQEVGASYASVGQAVRGRSWAHVAEPPVAQRRRWTKSNPRRISDETALRAQEMAAQGLSLQAIADELGVNRCTAYDLTQPDRVAS
jgi:hypothetical protein